MALCFTSIKFACICPVHRKWYLCCGFSVLSRFVRVIVPPLYLFSTSTEVQAKSAFLNKESVQREVKATLSQKATLCCEVVDNKTEVKWYKDGKLLSPSRAVQMESKGKTRQLVFSNVEKKDAGVYMCEVGTDKLEFKVQVTGMRISRQTVYVRGL